MSQSPSLKFSWLNTLLYFEPLKDIALLSDRFLNNTYKSLKIKSKTVHFNFQQSRKMVLRKGK